MKQVLWINSCMRGAGQSRTLELCRTFLEELRVRRPGLKVAERDLTRAELPVMTAELSRRREELAAEGREDPLLLPAREMARAGEQRGLCRAERLIYITTAGGPLEDRNFGYEYVRGVAGMLGIINTHCVAAQGLDIRGNDPEALLREAQERAARLAAEI